jgi:hypothetical protein
MTISENIRRGLYPAEQIEAIQKIFVQSSSIGDFISLLRKYEYKLACDESTIPKEIVYSDRWLFK